MSGCFGNTRYDRYLENQVLQYYRECEADERRAEEEEENKEKEE